MGANLRMWLMCFGRHEWGDWKPEHRAPNVDMNYVGQYVGTDKRVCKVCGAQQWRAV